MAIQTDSSAPYTAAKPLLGVIEGYRERGLQTPFTHEVLIKAGVSETLAPRTMQALELLGLVDEAGNPTETLEGLRKAPADEYRERFAEFVRGAYAEVFAFADPARDSRERVRDAFRSYAPVGQQERMVSLFFALCEYAEIIEAKPAPRRSSGATRTAKRTPAQRAKPKAATEMPAREPPPSFTPSPAPSTDQHPFVVGLLQSLPEVGTVWSDAKREDWVKAALAVFNMIYERPPEESIAEVRLTPTGEEG